MPDVQPMLGLAIDDSALPNGESTMRLSILSPRDERGRCTFTLGWWGYRPDLEAKGPRGQYFYARPEDHVADLERRGWRVTMEE